MLYPQGTVNLNAASAPGIYTQIFDPQQRVFPGAISNRLAIVGIADGGDVNKQVFGGDVTELSRIFGQPQNRKYDLMTAVAIGSQLGVKDFVCVRVTDGTDVAATVNLLDVTSPSPATGLTLTALSTGTLGNQIQVLVQQSGSYTSGAPKYQIVIAQPNGISEIFDNIGGSGNAFWINAAAAINNGQQGARGPSQLVVATAGAATLGPALSTYTLSGGTSGNTTITDSVILGSESPRKGMYVLRDSFAGVGMLTDVTDVTSIASQITFAAQEGIQMVMAGPAGQSLATAITLRQTQAFNNGWFKYLVGDHCYWNDTYNQISSRLVSNQHFYAGIRAALGIAESTLNKTISNVVATQTTRAKLTYTKDDISLAVANGLDFIYAPSVGGNYFSMQTGVDTNTTNNLMREDKWAIITSYVARTLAPGLATFIGQQINPNLLSLIKSEIVNTLQAMADAGIIGAYDGSTPYSVDVRSSAAQAQQGIVEIDVDVANTPIFRTGLLNLTNGSLTIPSGV